MTPSRLVLRLVLVMALAGVVFIGYKKVVQKSPTYYREQAEMALRAGDRKSAISLFRKMVTDLEKRNSSEPEIRQLQSYAHQRLGDLSLQEAKTEGHGDTYATNPVALHELEAAAEADPDNLELQKTLMKTLLEIPLIDAATAPATRVAKQEPNNPDAMFVLAWQAVAKDHADAEDYLKKLEKLDSSRRFQVLRLRVNAEMQGQHREVEVQRLLDVAVAEGSKLDDKQILAQDRMERDSLINLLIFSITQSKDAKAATARADSVIDTCERLSEQETKTAPPPAEASEPDLFHPKEEKPDAKKKKPTKEAPGTGVGYYANLVSRAYLSLNSKYPVDPKNVSERAHREELSSRANSLRQKAIRAGQATPLVYHQAAMVLFSEKQTDEAMKLLDEAIEKGKKAEIDRKEYLELHLLAARQLILARRFNQVEQHLAPLDADRDYEGWGQLLHGAVASANGAHEKARGFYERAQRKLGNVTLVHMTLANTYLSLKQWDKALEHLNVLRENVSRGNPEETQWAIQQHATENQVHWGEFQAYLELNRLADAQKKLLDLEKTEFGPRAWAVMANFYLKQKNLPSAIAQLNDARTRFPGDLTIINLYAKMLSSAGKPDEGQAIIAKAAADAPNDLTAQLFYVRYLINQQKPNDAVDLCDKLLTQFEEKHAIYVLKAQALLAADRPKEAEKVADILSTIKGGENASGIINFITDLEERDLGSAAKQLEKLKERMPENGQVGVILGQVEMNRGNFAAAAENFGIALDMTDYREKAGQGALNALVLLAQREGPLKAEEKLGELMVKHPENKHLLIARAEMKFRQGQFEDGLKALDRMAQLNPQDPLPHFLKAGGWWKRKRIDKAKEEIKVATTIDPKHLDSWALLADIQLSEKKYKQAIGAAEEGLKIDPRASKLYLVQAEANSKLGNVDEAAGIVRKLLIDQPKNLLARRQLAQIYIEANRIDDALKVYREGRLSNSATNSDLQALGAVEFALLSDEITLLSKNKRFDEAQKLVASVVGKTPSAGPCLQLAMAYTQADQFEEAEKWGQKALTLLPPNGQPQAHLVLGRNAYRWVQAVPTNKVALKEARTHFEKVVEVNNRNYEAANALALLLATEFNEPASAIKVAEALRGNVALEQLPPEFIDTLAICYTAANRGSEAEQILSDILRLRPDDANLNFRLGMVFVAQKKNASARGCFEKALRLEELPEAKSLEAIKKLEWLNSLTSVTPAPEDAPNNN